MGRVRSFKPARQQMIDSIGSLAGTLMIHGILYDARSMKVGINIDKIQPYACMLRRYMEIDPRGGFFDQDDVEDGWEHWAVDERYAAAVAQLSAKLQLSHKELKAGVYNSSSVVQFYFYLQFSSCLSIYSFSCFEHLLFNFICVYIFSFLFP